MTTGERMAKASSIVYFIEYTTTLYPEWRKYSGVYVSKKAANNAMFAAMDNADVRGLNWEFRIVRWDELNQRVA